MLPSVVGLDDVPTCWKTGCYSVGETWERAVVLNGAKTPVSCWSRQ